MTQTHHTTEGGAETIPASLSPGMTGILSDCVALLRPTQWVKNVVVFAGPAAAGELRSSGSLVRTLVAFGTFCLVASAGYAINDVLDRDADALHPLKRSRPVARGAIRPATAYCLALLLAGTAISTAWWILNPRFTGVLSLYFVMILAYSITLKKRMILDVIVIAIGFVLRAWGGSLAVGVETSEWLVACVFTLCLFMGFGKRRCELAMIPDVNEAGQHRRTLLRYTPDLLNHLITVSSGIAVITFLLYTLDSGVQPVPFPRHYLFYTLPLVVYGIFRFAMLTELGDFAGPTEIVLKDRAILFTVLLWASAALAIVYFAPTLESAVAG